MKYPHILRAGPPGRGDERSNADRSKQMVQQEKKRRCQLKFRNKSEANPEISKRTALSPIIEIMSDQGSEHPSTIGLVSSTSSSGAGSADEVTAGDRLNQIPGPTSLLDLPSPLLITNKVYDVPFSLLCGWDARVF